MITDRTLTPGDRFEMRYRKAPYRVVYNGNAPAPFAGEYPPGIAGKPYRSLSDAGRQITGHNVNGWRAFDRLEQTADPESFAPPAPDTPPPPADGDVTEARVVRRLPADPKAKMVKLIIRVGNQAAVPEGSTRWFCRSGMHSFIAPGTARPEACPDGHPAEAPAERDEAWGGAA